MLGFSLSGFTYPASNMLPAVQALCYLEPLRHYYLIYVNEALMGAPTINSLTPALALCGFMLLSITTAPRLHKALRRAEIHPHESMETVGGDPGRA